MVVFDTCVDRNERKDKQCGDRSSVAVLVFRQHTVLTSHHPCSGDLIHRAVFLAAGSGACTRDLLYFWSLASEEIHNTWLSSKAFTAVVAHTKGKTFEF